LRPRRSGEFPKDVSEEEVAVLQQGHPTDESVATDHGPVIGDDRPGVEASGDKPLPDPDWWNDPSTTDEPVTATATTTRWGMSWGQVLIVLAGVVSIVFGIGAVALAGLAGSVTAPVVNVFTYDHTPLLGLIEIGVGVVLVLTGLVPGGRWVAGPVGVSAIVGGALVVAQLQWTQTNLAAEQRFGWVAIAVGSVAYLGAMAPARKRTVAAR
jgi:hypothetical protein